MEQVFEKIDRFFERIKRMNFIKFILIAWVLNFVWMVVVGSILYLSGAKFSQHVASTNEFTNSFLLVPLVAVAEEMLFRWAPMLILIFALTYAYRTGRLTKDRYFYVEKRCLLALAVVSSVIFGWVHGNIFNLLIQGVSGCIMFITYLRAFFIERDRGVRDRWQIVPLAEASLYHAMANTMLIIL